MAATVYIADVNEINADNIMKQYTQAFPPNDRELLLSWAGRHWKPNDPAAKLPQPEKGHVLLRDATVPAGGAREEEDDSDSEDLTTEKTTRNVVLESSSHIDEL